MSKKNGSYLFIYVIQSCSIRVIYHDFFYLILSSTSIWITMLDWLKNRYRCRKITVGQINIIVLNHRNSLGTYKNWKVAK